MRVVWVWREGGDYSRTVEEWIMGYERWTGREIETIRPDGRDGVGFCEAYDVVEYPTILALRDDGAVAASWKGRELPLFDEVAYWA